MRPASFAAKWERVLHHEGPSVAQLQPNFGISRKARKGRKGRTLSFRTEREILLRSFAFALDDRPLACHFATLAALARGISESEASRLPDNLPKPRKLSRIVVRRSRSSEIGLLAPFVISFENTREGMICTSKSLRGLRHAGAGRHPDPSSTWIPFFNGMTDSVPHLDSRVRGNDESRRGACSGNANRFYAL
jgi:hypothetical protein